MIKWSKELYLDATIIKNPNKWKHRVEKSDDAGNFPPNIYCICLASNEHNLFDIMNCRELFFQYYRSHDIYITGLARNKEDALDLMQDMIEDIYLKTGDIKIREYFTFRKG